MDKVRKFTDGLNDYSLSGQKSSWLVIVSRVKDAAQVCEQRFSRKKLAIAWITQQGAT